MRFSRPILVFSAVFDKTGRSCSNSLPFLMSFQAGFTGKALAALIARIRSAPTFKMTASLLHMAFPVEFAGKAFAALIARIRSTSTFFDLPGASGFYCIFSGSERHS